jgi:hypothetical protein
MRSGVSGLVLVAVSALVLAVGCGDSKGAADATTTTTTSTPSAEALWIKTFESTLATMRRDLRSFIRTGRTAEGVVFSDESGPRYFCGRRLGEAGKPPTSQLAEVRRHALEACGHLHKALEASMTFRATTVPGGHSGGDREGAADAARQAKAPMGKALALLETARSG